MEAYESIEEWKKGLHYHQKSTLLRDSLLGTATQNRIHELEAENSKQNEALNQAKLKQELVVTQSKLEKLMLSILLIALIIAFVVYSFVKKRQNVKRELAQNKANLTNLTQLLVSKNNFIRQLQAEQQKVDDHLSTPETATSNNLFDQQILTDKDWQAFKSYFEKSTPGYIQKLRKQHPELSESEERLFLLLKLQLTRKEIAAILGISPESVKKTRSRLRKRLALKINDKLEAYIHNF
ncbi:MAG: sigma factor-like helix-turn-helix DNA-binding protein, partial [Bacteroidota bacterium]